MSAKAGGSGKFRIAAIIVLGIAAIIVLVSGWRDPECGRLDAREALVRQIGDRLYERLGSGQPYELTWRPDRLAVISAAGGDQVCRAGFDYIGPDGPGLVVVDYAVSRKSRGQVWLKDMLVMRGAAGTLKPPLEARNF